MCGIVGYSGSKSASKVLIEGLKRLEYRGYDSAGIAIKTDKGIVITKKEGKIKNLEDTIDKSIKSNKSSLLRQHKYLY